ncbi:hypothetical protein [Rhodocyclus tenuis]|nr:hypothetical protein [Rhodocyclus tenuis]
MEETTSERQTAKRSSWTHYGAKRNKNQAPICASRQSLKQAERHRDGTMQSIKYQIVEDILRYQFTNNKHRRAERKNNRNDANAATQQKQATASTAKSTGTSEKEPGQTLQSPTQFDRKTPWNAGFAGAEKACPSSPKPAVITP